MIWKLLLTLGIAALVWALVARGRRAGGPPRLPSPKDLIRCARCGVHRLPGRPCACPQITRD